MEKEAKLLVVLDEKGIRTEIKGSVPDVMFMTERALTECRMAMEKVKPISHEDAIRLMDEVIKSYQTEAKFGPEVATEMAFMEFLKHC